jgi:thiamine pyrophosphate-dependent acetolactate synthase large subunit-like protein
VVFIPKCRRNYALATHKPTVVQLHSSVGLGNALGSLYHVFRKQRSPLVVIAGEAGVAYDALGAHLADLARPVTKYAARAIHAGSLLRLLRRCIKVAATPPFGPTFLAIPQDVVDQENHEEVHEPNPLGFPRCFDIHDPSVDYVSLAKGFGVRTPYQVSNGTDQQTRRRAAPAYTERCAPS